MKLLTAPLCLEFKQLHSSSPQSHSITGIQRQTKGSNKSGLLQQVVFKYRFYLFNSRSCVVFEKLSVRAVDCLIQVVSNTGLTLKI